MKKSVLALCLISGIYVAQGIAADKVATATATWQATAVKNTSDDIVVTPTNASLTFNYDPATKMFNTQKGLYDISIKGSANATGFKLTSRVVANTLRRTDDASTLTVGVQYNGHSLSTDSPVTLVDSTASAAAGNLNPLLMKYNGALDAASYQAKASDSFTFNIASATDSNAKLVTADFSGLHDGVWSGDVSVEFDATWTGGA